MNLYQTKLFAAADLNGPRAGEFIDPQGIDLNDWMQGQAEYGYLLLSLQPVSYNTGLYVLVTMERAEFDDDDDPMAGSPERKAWEAHLGALEDPQ